MYIYIYIYTYICIYYYVLMPPEHVPQVRASADAGGLGRKHPHLSVAVDPLRHSDPVAVRGC